mmetsp:Transcript_14050/g.52706  ORF Transcript_14050/g.52706 Transcript_14050/m.52706 type:complete len:281 (+) Transcript_14050:3239-4081(+)
MPLACVAVAATTSATFTGGSKTMSPGPVLMLRMLSGPGWSRQVPVFSSMTSASFELTVSKLNWLGSIGGSKVTVVVPFGGWTKPAPCTLSTVVWPRYSFSSPAFTVGVSKILATTRPRFARVDPRGTQPLPMFSDSSRRGPGKLSGFCLHLEPSASVNVSDFSSLPVTVKLRPWPRMPLANAIRFCPSGSRLKPAPVMLSVGDVWYMRRSRLGMTTTPAAWPTSACTSATSKPPVPGGVTRMGPAPVSTRTSLRGPGSLLHCLPGSSVMVILPSLTTCWE